MSTKNPYAEGAKRKKIMGLSIKKHSKEETIEHLKHGGSIIAGAVAGALIGRPSLLLGLAVTVGGHFVGSTIVSSCGVGMIVSGGYQAISGVSGPGETTVSARLKALAENVKHRLYLDKIMKPKTKAAPTDGLGNVQYFQYPEQNKEPDFSGLDDIQRQIEESAEDFSGQISGAEEDDAPIL